MQRRAQILTSRFSGCAQHCGHKSFHIRRSSTIDLAVFASHGEGGNGPNLPHHRHHIRMTRQHHPSTIARPDGGKQIGLAAFCILNNLHISPHSHQLRLHPSDQICIRMGAGGVKGQQLFKIV